MEKEGSQSPVAFETAVLLQTTNDGTLYRITRPRAAIQTFIISCLGSLRTQSMKLSIDQNQ